MMRAFLLLAALPLAGCVSTVAHVVTAPVRVVGWTADKMTTSQSEADRNYGRKIRKEEERRGREARREARERRSRDR